MIILDKTGGRTVQLYIPFEHNGKKIEHIAISALRLGHVRRWNEGVWKSVIALLADMAGVSETVIYDLRYPDADRVMDQFMALLTPEMREDVINNRVPLKPEIDGPLEEIDEPARATNGSGELMGPGDPLPPGFDNQPGFDLSEEP